MSDEPEWFAARRYGIGSGPPIAWQGWAVLGAYLVLLGLASFVIRYGWVGYVSIVTMLTVMTSERSIMQLRLDWVSAVKISVWPGCGTPARCKASL